MTQIASDGTVYELTGPDDAPPGSLRWLSLSRGVVEGVMLGWGGGGVFRIYSVARHTYAAGSTIRASCRLVPVLSI